MKSIGAVAPALAGVLIVTHAADADPLHYLGRQAASTTGFIELGHEEYYEVGPGTEIPAWGRVKEVQEFRLVVEQVRTEAEKRQTRELGAMAYDVLEIHVPRHDLRHPRREGLPPSQP